MIQEISLTNIRVFEDQQWSFALSPLTVFCGTNSAGKSTVLKTLLLLQQSIGAPGENIKKSGFLKFSGRFVDLGDYEALVSQNQQGKPIRIKLQTTVVIPKSSRWLREELERTLPHLKGIDELREYRLIVDFTFVHSSIVKASSNSLKAAENSADVDLTEPYTSPEFGHGLLESAKFELQFGEDTLRWDVTIDTSAAKKNPSYKISLLNSLLPRYFLRERKEKSRPRTDYATHGVDLDGILPSSIRVSKTDLNESVVSDGSTTFRIPLPSIMELSLHQLRRDLQNIHYLGPLRSPGKRFYVLNPDYFSEFDAAGEFLPYILRDRRYEQIQFCSPAGLFRSRTITLEEALNEWLYYLKHGKSPSERSDRGSPEFESEFQKQVLGELRLRGGSSTKTHALVDSGFGYSQVLPILVRGLLTPIGGMFIVEQPELHLHPALQVRLAAFFIGMSYSDRTILVETHSEHIVNALRTVAAENPETDLHKRIKVHFIDGESDRPRLFDLSVRPDGTVPAMPQQFFGEGLRLSSRLLRAQRRHIKPSSKE